MQAFGKWLLDIGDGIVPSIKHLDHDEGSWIQIPNVLLLQKEGNSLAMIMKANYPDFHDHFS